MNRRTKDFAVVRGATMVSIRRDVLLKKREVAERFRVTTRTVEKWIARGLLDAVQIGGRVYSSYEALERFVSHRERNLESVGATHDSSTTDMLALNHGV